MGMFDDLLIHKSLIDEAIKDTDLSFEDKDGYYYFQTKDLDNLLNCYYLQEDGNLVLKEQEYEFIEDNNNEPKSIFNLGYKNVPIGEPEYIKKDISNYVSFHEYYETDKESLFVEFNMHIKNGKLDGGINIVSIERKDLKEIQEKQKKHSEMVDKLTSTWEWKVANVLNNYLYLFNKTSEKILDYFRNQANNKVGYYL